MDRRQAVSLVLVVLVLAAYVVTVTDRGAKQRALAHEEAYLRAELSNASCVTSFGTFETTDEKRARVVGRHLDGRTVRVVHPYWYGTNRSEVDAASVAVYSVSGETVRRVRGEPLNLPC